MGKIRALASALTVTLMLAFAGVSVGTLVPMTAHAQAASCSVAAGGQIIIIGGKAVCFPPSANACPVTVGTLTLSAVVATRSAGISPFLEFFDATGTTDSATLGGANTPFQDIYYAWTFGDSGSSGTGTWAYGSNPGVNSQNGSTGAIAAHLYIVTDGAGDTNYVATAHAYDGTNTASCNIGVTAYDPIGANGFTSGNTTCFFNTAVGSGCPSGATQTTASTFSAVNGSLSNKRLLYKCGDTFTGDNETISGVKWSVGAYGGCQGTQTNQPIFSDSTASNPQIAINSGAGDGRISDIYFNGQNAGGTGHGAVTSQAFVTTAIPYQITLWNLQAINDSFGYSWSEGAQWGLIGSTMLSGVTGIGVFINQEENNPASMTGTIPNIWYHAIIGGFFNGVGSGTGSGVETMRTSACRMCVFENNTIQNANTGGAVFKMHNGNTYQSCGGGALTNCGCGGTCVVPCTVGGEFALASCWTGQYTELIEISDNWFGGNSGGVLSDIAPENGAVDERLRNIVIERNVYAGPTNMCCDVLLMVTGANMTVRDNVFYMTANGSIFPEDGVAIIQRGAGQSGYPTATVQYNEAYNNTCYAPSSENNQECVGFDTSAGASAATANSFAANNLFYIPTLNGSNGNHAVNNTGSGNTVSNNTATVTANPSFTNSSTTFSLISDFKPTANYTGGTSVPVWYDALGVAWSPTWDLGAVHH